MDFLVAAMVHQKTFFYELDGPITARCIPDISQDLCRPGTDDALYKTVNIHNIMRASLCKAASNGFCSWACYTGTCEECGLMPLDLDDIGKEQKVC